MNDSINHEHRSGAIHGDFFYDSSSSARVAVYSHARGRGLIVVVDATVRFPHKSSANDVKGKKGEKICREIEIQFGVIFAPFLVEARAKNR